MGPAVLQSGYGYKKVRAPARQHCKVMIVVLIAELFTTWIRRGDGGGGGGGACTWQPSGC